MTQVKERAFQMLRDLPDEKVIYIVKIMEGLEGLGAPSQTQTKKEALASIQKFRGRLSGDFDYKKELEESRREGNNDRGYFTQCLA